jgi:hypothetical protein
MRTHILVAGVDYEFSGVDFRIFCNNRMKRLVAANKKQEDLTFQLIDFRRGEVLTHEVSYPAGKKTETTKPLSPSPFKPISKANYAQVVSGTETHYHFKDGQTAILSILDIYKAVRAVGANAPNTLVELSFFSHAGMVGPILVNSFDDGQILTFQPPLAAPIPVPLPPGARDPDDMDPRAAKDFVPPTMDAPALANFQRAFHADGFIWIWGCAFPLLVHEILYKIEGNPAYKPSGLGDDVVFELKTLNAAQADLLERVLLPELGAPFPDKKQIRIQFKFLKHFFCKITTASYPHHLARAAKVKTFAGVMGTYSQYDQGPLALMSVHKGFKRHLEFYKNYLGFDFDPENRGYGKYDPAFACVAPSP